MLAGPVLLGCVFATAASMKYILQFEFSFVACAMIGAIASATDPVAVVAILKELGVNKTIGTLIEGESLLNDGTAMVCFIILKSFVEAEETGEPTKNFGEIVWTFTRMSIFAPIIGLIVAWLMSAALKRIHNDPVLEGNLTVCVPYILFYVTEALQMSGILALVACGLYMTKEGRVKISSESEHSIHAVWSYIGFVAETVIFMMTGNIVGIIVVKNGDPIWFAQLLGLYFMLHIIRFGFLLLVMPILKMTGYPFDLKACTLVAYGGLRGAVGLALALIV